ncbi:MAG: 5-formyltetrahydrofolate cyclo-ligase [Deltaproteobacteria bacterium]|nr:5-formyltetrahydrofolate cyclo-ligase [Deltaproteobacteria bacterium]
MTLTKVNLRKKILAFMAQQPPFQQEALSQKIEQHLLQLTQYHSLKSVGFYIDFKGEVKTKGLIEQAFQAQKRVAVPVIHHSDSECRFCWIDSLEVLEKSSFGFLQPSKKSLLAKLNELEAIFVPGVAFSKEGDRLGRGKGFYDRVLKEFRGLKIGLAYNFQILDVIPTDAWDQKLDGIVTESGILKFNDLV